jgi:hypothetical protein
VNPEQPHIQNFVCLGRPQSGQDEQALQIASWTALHMPTEPQMMLMEPMEIVFGRHRHRYQPGDPYSSHPPLVPSGPARCLLAAQSTRASALPCLPRGPRTPPSLPIPLRTRRRHFGAPCASGNPPALQCSLPFTSAIPAVTCAHILTLVLIPACRRK